MTKKRSTWCHNFCFRKPNPECKERKRGGKTPPSYVKKAARAGGKYSNFKYVDWRNRYKAVETVLDDSETTPSNMFDGYEDVLPEGVTKETYDE